MDKHNHTEDTIDVHHLLHKSQEGANYFSSEETHDDTAFSPVAQSSSNNITSEDQPTQTLPGNYSSTAPLAQYASRTRYGEQQDLPTPEALDQDDFVAQDSSDEDRKKKIWIISICAGVFALLLALIMIIIIASGDGNGDAGDADIISDNVYAAGISLGGKSAEQAKNLLHLKTDHTFEKESMVVKLPGSSINLAPDQTGAKLDVDAVVEAALKVDRSGVVSSDGNYNIALLPYLTLNLDYIQDTINTFCETYSSVLSDPVILLEGNRPVFDPEYPDKQVTHQSLLITLGTPEYVLDADSLYTQVLDAYSMNQLVVEYDAPDLIEPKYVDVLALYEQYCTPPQDAVINPATYEITPEIYGYGFDINQLQNLLDDAYYGETVRIEFSYLVPNVLSSDFSKDMFIDTLSQYQISSNINDSKRDNNLSLSCNALNNYVINAGSTFSFNEVIGKITTTNGYATAPVSELNGSIMGGGISQTASALYTCALIADLDIVEHHNHEYAVDFCELGLDAAIDGNEKDLRFRNNTSAPIRIIAEANDGRVHIEIQGTHEIDYKIELVPQIISKIDPLTSYQNMEANNPAGYMDGDILQKGITGYQVKLYIEKYALDSGLLLSKEEVTQSKYAKADEVVIRITPEVTEPTVPSEETDVTEDPELTDPSIDTNPTDPVIPSDTAA